VTHLRTLLVISEGGPVVGFSIGFSVLVFLVVVLLSNVGVGKGAEGRLGVC